MNNRKPVCLGLVGGIGCGKSTLARWLANQLDWLVIDADKIGHQILDEADTVALLCQTFGQQISRPCPDNPATQIIDRSKLAALVFGASPTQQENRRKLESIVHPRIAERLHQQLAETTKSGVILDAPVLLEAGWGSKCDALVFVRSSWETRVRNVAARGWTAQQLLIREESQWPLDRKEDHCEWSVENDASIDISGAKLLGWVRQRFNLPDSPHVVGNRY